MMLTDLPTAAKEAGQVLNVWAGTDTFVQVMKFHPCYKFTTVDCGVVNAFLVDLLRLRELFDLGNGHQLQQFRRAYGLPVTLKPTGSLTKSVEGIKDRVILHFEPSLRNVSWQRKHWHPRMRELYSTSRYELESFIRGNRQYEFVQVGRTDAEIMGSRFVPTSTVEDLVNIVQTGSYFLGIMSGPMHIAVASGLRCVVVVNYPPVSRIVLPCLRYTGTPEEEWMYPQNVHLHQEGESALVPKLSKKSLEAAFNGDVYPFWQDTWLDMIDEPL